jgi:transposase-like protein
LVDRGEAGDREIVAESLGFGVRPSEIIQRHGITSGQLYAWRQQLTRRVDGQPVRPVAKFARVDVVAAEQASQAEPPASPSSKPQTHVPAIAAPRAKGLIEILLPGGASVRVDGQVDERALRCVLDGIGAVI